MKVKLNYEELLVLDWILHFPVGSPNQDHLYWLDQNFSLLRANLWKNILVLRENRELREIELEIPEEKGQLLMTMIPTTFRWATGKDAGFNLKLKLTKALWVEPSEVSEVPEYLKKLEREFESSPKRMRKRKGGGSHATD